MLLNIAPASAAAPTLSAGAATFLGPTGATLNGTFTAAGTTSSSQYRPGTAKFCYSTSSALANCTGATSVTLLDSNLSPTYLAASPDTSAHTISAAITGLTNWLIPVPTKVRAEKPR